MHGFTVAVPSFSSARFSSRHRRSASATASEYWYTTRDRTQNS